MSQKITRLSKSMVLLLLALLPLCSVAQRKGFKMVESVPAEMPSWVGGDRGNLAVKLVYQERTITTSQKPVFKSNCANDFSYRYDDGLLYIGFDDEYCGYTDIPTLTVVFKVANLKIQKEIKLKQ